MDGPIKVLVTTNAKALPASRYCGPEFAARLMIGLVERSLLGLAFFRALFTAACGKEVAIRPHADRIDHRASSWIAFSEQKSVHYYRRYEDIERVEFMCSGADVLSLKNSELAHQKPLFNGAQKATFVLHLNIAEMPSDVISANPRG